MYNYNNNGFRSLRTEKIIDSITEKIIEVTVRYDTSMDRIPI